MEKLGFIGLGLMGEPMAKNLIGAGYRLIVYDISEEAVQRLVDIGAARAKSPKEVSRHSSVVLTMLPNGPDVKDVVLGSAGVIEGVEEGNIFVDMSSISPVISQEIGKKLAKFGVKSLDAPVSGGVEKARTGTLAFMVGGKKDTFEKCKDILKAMGQSVTLVGDLGAGQTTKLVNQMIVAGNIAIIAEALTFGKEAGVDPKEIFRAIRTGLAASQCLEDKGPRMFTGDFAPGFRIDLHIKDLTNVFDTSRTLQAFPLPLTSQVMEMMQSIAAEGNALLDHSALALFYENITGVSLQK